MTTSSIERTILIIDDSLEDREAYRRYLTKESKDLYRIVEAELGRGILAICEQCQPDAVLLDYSLPDASGLTVLEQIKNRAPACPVIMLTGQGDETVAVQAIKKGAEDYLIKGQTSPNKLRLVLQNAIENAELRQQLQKSEQRFRVAVEHLSDCLGIYVAVRDNTGRIVDFQVEYLNEAACQYPKILSRDQQMGRRLSDLFPKNRENGLFEAYCQVVETGSSLVRELLTYDDENPGCLKQATDLRASKINDGFVATWRNITERKQSELFCAVLINREKAAREVAERSQEQYCLAAERSQESQRFIEQVADTTPGILYIYDLIEQRNVYVNQKVETLLGYAPEHLQMMGGDLFTRLIHPDDLVHIPDHLDRLNQTQAGEILSIEYRMQHANGQWSWFSCREVVFRRTDDGTFWQLLGVAQDITELKQAQENLQQQLERDRLIQSITQQIRQSLNLEDILQTTVAQIRQTLHCDRVLIFKMTSKDDGSVISESVGEGWISLLDNTFSDPCFKADYAERYRQGHIMAVADIYHANLAPCYINFLAQLQVQASLVIPILDGEQLWGLLTAQHCEAPREWESSEVQLLQSLAVQAGISIQQAELYQQSQVELAQRQKVELELHIANQRYELAAAAVNCLIYDWDLQAQVVKRSSELLPLLGYTPEEAETELHWWRNLIHPDDIPRVDEECAAILAQGDRITIEYRVRHRQGHYIWVLDHAIVLRQSDGTIVRMVGSTRNISHRKQFEERLKEQEERIRLALDAAKMGSWDWDLSTDQVTWSPYHEILFGYEPGFPNRTLADWASRVYPLDLRNVEVCIEHARTTQQQYQCEYRVVWPDGSLHWISALGKFYYDQNDKPIRMVGMINDFTDRKQAEVELETALQKLNFHVENSPLAVIEWDAQFKVCRWSASAEQIFGWQAEEVMGKSPFDWQFIFEEDFAATKAVIDEFKEGANSRHMSSNRNYRKDGTIVHCEWYNSTLNDELGQLASVLSLVQDVSDRVLLITERDRILLLEQGARAEAEAANQAKDDFIAIVSHELRSPLNSILGWTKLLSMGRIDAETLPQALQSIERGAQAQVQIVDDLLDISRMIMGKLNLVITPFDLMPVIQTAINLNRPAVEAKQINLVENLQSPHNFKVSGDSQRIQQVIGNLLTNAIKFTPAGGLIEVKLEPFEPILEEADAEILEPQTPSYPFSRLPPPSYAKITVRDTGKGISADLLPHVFDRFRQDKRISGKTKDGLGLGLAIVKQLVEMHQGKVSVECPGEGMGSTFTVLLPLIHKIATQEASASPALPQLANGKARILIIEDNPDALTFLQFALEDQGLIIAAGTTAQQGMELFSSFKPDLLISDIGMAEEDGYSFMRRIRLLEAEQGTHTPAIALTAFTQDKDRDKAIACGYELYLTKPVDLDALMEAIVSLLNPST